MRFLSKKQVKQMVLYSYAQLARMEREGRFPKRVPLGPGRVGYVEQEILDWMQKRADER